MLFLIFYEINIHTTIAYCKHGHSRANKQNKRNHSHKIKLIILIIHELEHTDMHVIPSLQSLVRTYKNRGWFLQANVIE